MPQLKITPLPAAHHPSANAQLSIALPTADIVGRCEPSCLANVRLRGISALSMAPAAQAVAYFTARAGGKIARQKLLALLYLADREGLRRYGAMITGDYLLALPSGPGLWHITNVLGSGRPLPTPWNEWIEGSDAAEVALTRDVCRDNLDHLSEVNMECLDAAWRQAGGLDSADVPSYLQRYCPEGNIAPDAFPQISEITLLEVLGHGPADARWIFDRLETHRHMNEYFATPPGNGGEPR